MCLEACYGKNCAGIAQLLLININSGSLKGLPLAHQSPEGQERAPWASSARQSWRHDLASWPPLPSTQPPLQGRNWCPAALNTWTACCDYIVPILPDKSLLLIASLPQLVVLDFVLSNSSTFQKIQDQEAQSIPLHSLWKFPPFMTCLGLMSRLSSVLMTSIAGSTAV